MPFGTLSIAMALCLIRMRVMKLILLLLGFTASILGKSQADSCRVIKVTDKNLNSTSVITESYSPNGIYLLQNAIYNLKITGQTYTNYRILKIWNDSLQIAWTLDSIPSSSFAISEIQKVIFPSLNDGVVGFPHPSMKAKSINLKWIVVCHID